MLNDGCSNGVEMCEVSLSHFFSSANAAFWTYIRWKWDDIDMESLYISIFQIIFDLRIFVCNSLYSSSSNPRQQRGEVTDVTSHGVQNAPPRSDRFGADWSAGDRTLGARLDIQSGVFVMQFFVDCKKSGPWNFVLVLCFKSFIQVGLFEPRGQPSTLTLVYW